MRIQYCGDQNTSGGIILKPYSTCNSQVPIWEGEPPSNTTNGVRLRYHQSDFFAVRPHSFAIIPASGQSIDLLHAGSFNHLTLYAYDGTGNSHPTDEYNQTKSNLSLTTIKYMGDGTPDTGGLLTGNTEFGSTDFQMKDGISTDSNNAHDVADITYTDVGKINLHIEDVDWAAVDIINGNNSNQNCQSENESLNNPGGSGYYIGVFADHVIWDNGALSGYGPFRGYDDYTQWVVAMTAGLGNDQVGDEGWYGKLSDSTDHAINFIGNFHLPYDFNITTAVQWNSGYFWTKKGYQPLYGAYFTFPEGRGSRRTSSLLWIDVTLTKDFKVWYDHTLQLRLDIMNLLNTQQPISFVEEDTVDFGTPFARQAPRAIQVGIAYRF